MLKYVNETINNVIYLNALDKAYVNLEGYREMTDAEVKKHETNPYLDHMVWDDLTESWIDKRTPEEVAEYMRMQMPNLTKREFRAKLRDAKLFEQVEAYVKVGDGYLQDAWEYADFFARLDPFIVQAGVDLGLLPEVIDHIWIYGKLPEVPEDEPTDVVVNEPESEIQ